MDNVPKFQNWNANNKIIIVIIIIIHYYNKNIESYWKPIEPIISDIIFCET
jgi:hypothetical protein